LVVGKLTKPDCSVSLYILPDIVPFAEIVKKAVPDPGAAAKLALESAPKTVVPVLCHDPD
jgi:hypothetical protein